MVTLYISRQRYGRLPVVSLLHEDSLYTNGGREEITSRPVAARSHAPVVRGIQGIFQASHSWECISGNTWPLCDCGLPERKRQRGWTVLPGKGVELQILGGYGGLWRPVHHRTGLSVDRVNITTSQPVSLGHYSRILVSFVLLVKYYFVDIT